MHFQQPFLHRMIICIALTISLCGLSSCKKKEEAPSPPPSVENRASTAPAGNAAQNKGEAVPQENKRKVILTHAVDLEVQEFKAALESLTKLAESSGGYIFKSKRNSQDSKYQWGEIGIRVPASKAGSVLTGIRGLGRVNRENSTAEDITEGYVDLEARLKNVKASESRLLELNHRAEKLTEVLEIEKELTRVRGEIESFEAKKKNWDILTEMVTIEINLHEASGGFPSFNRLWTLIKNGAGSAVEGLFDSFAFLIIFLGAVLPWLAVFGPLIYLYVRFRRKKRQYKSLQTPSNISNGRKE